jgi:WXG100 family type VII secretion target
VASNGPKTGDIDGMKAALPHFESALTETSRAYSSMQDQANTLEGSWTGDAAQTFISALNQWLENCSAIQQALQSVTEKLELNTSGMVQVHSDTTDHASNIQQLMAAGLPGF